MGLDIVWSTPVTADEGGVALSPIALDLPHILDLPVRYRAVVRAVHEVTEAAPGLLEDRFLLICSEDRSVIARAGDSEVLTWLTARRLTPGFRWDELPADQDLIRIENYSAAGRPFLLRDETLTVWVGRRGEACWDATAQALLACLKTKADWNEQELARQEFEADRNKLQTFHRLTSELSELHSPEEILTAVTARVTELLDAGTTVVFGINQAGTKLLPLAGHGIAPDELRSVRYEIDLDDNFVAQAHLTGQVRFCDDVDQPVGTQPVAALQSLTLKSALAVPIRAAERPLGVMVMGRYLRRRFDSSGAEVLAFTVRQIALLLENARLQAQLSQRLQALDKELGLAKEVQAIMLPKAPLESAGITALGRSWAAKAVGGDYFDYVADGQYLNMVVADIMGKGVSAALLLSILRSQVRSMWQEHPRLTADSVSHLGRQVHRDFAPHRSFVTVLMLSVNLVTRELSVFLAGHHAPLFVRQGALLEPFQRRAPVMGLTSQPITEDLIHRFALQPGDNLLAFTDGVSDTLGENRTRYGLDRLKSSLLSACMESAAPSEILDAIEQDLRRFTVEQPDDTTFCVMNVAP